MVKSSGDGGVGFYQVFANPTEKRWHKLVDRLQRLDRVKIVFEDRLSTVVIYHQSPWMPASMSSVSA